MACGGTGIISVSACVHPEGYVKIWDAWQDGDWEKVRKNTIKMLPLNQALSCVSNPAPVKYALERMGFGASRMRFHLGVLDEQVKRRILSVMPKCPY